MNGITRWNPFDEMEALHQRLSSVFGLAPVRAGESREKMTVAQWAPLVDITEDASGYVIKADLPEVKKEDVRVAVEDRVLTLSGERKFEKEDKSKKYHRVERSYGAFVRSFTLPEDADDSKVSAEFKDGVLRVTVARSESAKPKTIEVRVA